MDTSDTPTFAEKDLGVLQEARQIDSMDVPRNKISTQTKSQDSNLVFPVGIVHNNDEKESPFSAIGVLPIQLPPMLKESDEICIFSQERLCDCETLGAIVYSKTWKGSLDWRFLCNSKANLSDKNPKGVHIFEINYLKDWVKRKGTRYLTCPLCKEGAENDRKCDEHEIDSLDQLIERREQAKRQMDLPLLYFVEQLMVAKIAETNWDEDEGRARKQEQHLRDIMRHWTSRQQISNFLTKIVDALRKSVSHDIPTNVRILLQAIRGNAQSEVCSEMLALCAKTNSFDCAKLLCEEFAHVLEFELRPLALLESIKEMNVSMIEYLIEAMAKTKKRFVCDDCFKETIKKDMVDVAKQLIIQRWHKPTEEDFELSKKLDGSMWTYLSSRRNAIQNVSILDPNNDENVLTLDDDEWGSEEGDDFSELGDSYDC